MEPSQLSPRRARTKRVSVDKSDHRQKKTPATLSSARGHEGSDSAVCIAGDEGARTRRLRLPGFHHAIVEGVARGDGEMFLSKRERTCNFPPLDRTGPRDKGSRGRNVRSRCRCSLSPAIRISSRGWPRSSSTDEPSDPPSRVFSVFVWFGYYDILVLGVYEKFEEGRKTREKDVVRSWRRASARREEVSNYHRDDSRGRRRRLLLSSDAACPKCDRRADDER